MSSSRCGDCTRRSPEPPDQPYTSTTRCVGPYERRHTSPPARPTNVRLATISPAVKLTVDAARRRAARVGHHPAVDRRPDDGQVERRAGRRRRDAGLAGDAQAPLDAGLQRVARLARVEDATGRGAGEVVRAGERAGQVGDEVDGRVGRQAHRATGAELDGDGVRRDLPGHVVQRRGRRFGRTARPHPHPPRAGGLGGGEVEHHGRGAGAALVIGSVTTRPGPTGPLAPRPLRVSSTRSGCTGVTVWPGSAPRAAATGTIVANAAATASTAPVIRVIGRTLRDPSAGRRS